MQVCDQEFTPQLGLRGPEVTPGSEGRENAGEEDGSDAERRGHGSSERRDWETMTQQHSLSVAHRLLSTDDIGLSHDNRIAGWNSSTKKVIMGWKIFGAE